MFSVVPNRFKYRQNSCFRVVVFNIFSEVIRVVSNSVRLHALHCLCSSKISFQIAPECTIWPSMFSKLSDDASSLNWLIKFLMMTVIVRFHGIILCGHHRKRLEVHSFKCWPKRALLFKTWEDRDIIGLQRMIMVRKKR